MIRHPTLQLLFTVFFINTLLTAASPASENDERLNLGSGPIDTPQAAYFALKKVATMAAVNPSVRHQRFQRIGLLISYDFSCAKDFKASASDSHWIEPLEILVRTAEIDRDAQELFPHEQFWHLPLQRIQSAVERMLMAAYERDQAHRRDLVVDCHKEIDQAFAYLESELIVYVKTHDLRLVQPRSGLSGFRVSVIVEPRVGRVQIMYFLDYLLCKHEEQAALADKWNDLTPGPHYLEGRYHYRAEWPDGTVESNFVVDCDQILKFEPSH